MPPHSSHDGFTLIPQLAKLAMGQAPDDPHFGMFEGTWFPPVPWPEATVGWAPFWDRVFGNIRPHNWIDAPHPLALSSALTALMPGVALIPAVVMSGYFLLLLTSLAFIGARLANPKVGLLAATLAAGSPALFGMSRYVESHLPLVAMATAVVAASACLEGLRRWSLHAWSMCLGLSLLTWSLSRTGESAGELVIGGLLVAGPGLWALARSGRGTTPLRWLMGLLCLSLPFLLLADLPFLRASMESVTRGFADPSVQTDVVEKGGFWANTFVWRMSYLWLMATDYLSPALAIWVIPAAVGLWSIRKQVSPIAWLWFAVPFLALTIMQRKASWYGVGLVPPFILLMSMGLSALSRRWVVRGAIGTALLQLVLYSLVPATAFVGPLAQLRAPVPVSDTRLRRLDLLRPMDTPATAHLRNDTDTFIDWLNRTHPPDGQQHVVVAVAKGYGPDAIFRYRVSMSRPDVEVLNLTDPRARKIAYRGFTPNDFLAFVYLDEGLAPWPPTLSDRAWFADNLHCTADDPLDAFLAGVQARGLRRAPAEIPIYIFEGEIDNHNLGPGRVWTPTQPPEWSLCGP